MKGAVGTAAKEVQPLLEDGPASRLGLRSWAASAGSRAWRLYQAERTDGCNTQVPDPRGPAQKPVTAPLWLQQQLLSSTR